jgi:hypothetical protein
MFGLDIVPTDDARIIMALDQESRVYQSVEFKRWLAE